MSNVRIIGVSVKNGRQYPIFSTDEIIDGSTKEQHRKELSVLYKRELYLLTTSVDSDYRLPKSYSGDSEEKKVVPIENIYEYLR